ncbi:MAG: IclR family transcriptional regulator [Rhodospirillaceae bacterium]|nr:IclR family transcriptional regulator [Rhodospirillaceae bacterium]
MAPRKQNTQSDKAPALKGVRRSLQVLEYIALNPGRATDVAEGLNVSWATLHRTLSELEQGGFIARDADSNRYSIGPRMWFIGTAYLAEHKMLEAARPYLDAAAEAGDYTVQLVERSGRLAVTLYSYQTAGEVITKSTYGYHFPLHCGSKGQVLLAYSTPADIEEFLAGPLESLTPETVTQPKQLRKTLKEIKSQGYAQTVGDVQQFTGSLSAPVFDRAQQAVGAVCFITKRSAFRDAETLEEILETLLRTAHSTSLALGWRPGA